MTDLPIGAASRSPPTAPQASDAVLTKSAKESDRAAGYRDVIRTWFNTQIGPSPFSARPGPDGIRQRRAR